MTVLGLSLIGICIGYLIAMNLIAKSPLTKAFVVILFAALTSYLAYQALVYFNLLDGLTWMVLWFEFPILLVEFWFIKDIAEKITPDPPASPRNPTYYKSTPSMWVKTGS